MVIDIQAGNKVNIWIRGHKQNMKKAELSVLHVTLSIDLFYNSTKYH